MQKITFILGLFISLAACAQQDADTIKERSEAQLIKFFSDLDVEGFSGKTVDSFIRSVGFVPIKIEILPSSNPFYGGLIRVSYPKGIYVNIFIAEFLKTNANGICKKRNQRLARKEIIAAIHVLNEVACLQGCR